MRVSRILGGRSSCGSRAWGGPSRGTCGGRFKLIRTAGLQGALREGADGSRLTQKSRQFYLFVSVYDLEPPGNPLGVARGGGWVTPQRAPDGSNLYVPSVCRFDVVTGSIFFLRGTSGDNLTTDIREGADGDTEFSNCLPSPPAVFPIRFAVAIKRSRKPVFLAGWC